MLLEEVSAEETAGKCGSNCTVRAFRKEKWSLVKARNWGVGAELDPKVVLSGWDCPCLEGWRRLMETVLHAETSWDLVCPSLQP